MQQPPEIQQTLLENLKSVLGDSIAVLPNHAWNEFGLTIRVKAENLLDVAKALKERDVFQFNMLVDIGGVDWLDSKEERFEVVYQFLSIPKYHRLTVKVAVDEEACEVDSVRALWPAANFMEREVWDMFGISFRGHGDLRRILMYEEFVGYPLRKDYPKSGKQPRVHLRIPELRNTSGDMHKEELVAMPTRRPQQG